MAPKLLNLLLGRFGGEEVYSVAHRNSEPKEAAVRDVSCSIKTVAEVGNMCITPAFLVPRFGAFPDERDLSVPLLF